MRRIDSFRRALAFGVLARRVREELDWYRVARGATADFKGMCIIASATLVQAMALRGERATFVAGRYRGAMHCWVEWRGFIIDPTHSQFAAPDVLVVPRASASVYVEERRGGRAWRRHVDLDRVEEASRNAVLHAAERAAGTRAARASIRSRRIAG